MIVKEIQKMLFDMPESEIEYLKELVYDATQVILIGNGGSNAIASHIAVDYVKFLNTRSFAFTDSSMLTAYMNDYGVEDSYKQYIVDMHENGGIVILISSSGNSKNIYNAAEYCKENDISFVLLTGFEEDNLVRKDFKEYAAVEYWVDSKSYGVVECVHQIFLHSIIEN
jgi:D-sedoheptulose 7-phosphate isomerase